MVIALAVISIIYGALLAIGQTDMMRLIAFTSVSHFGFIVLGIFALTTVGGAGSTLYMVNHGFSTAGAVPRRRLCSSRRRGSKRIPDYGGWQRVTPVLAGVFLVAGLSSLALPGLSSFVSEFLVLQGTFMRYEAAAVIATLGIVLAALYILLMYQRTMTGPEAELRRGRGAARPVDREKVVVVPLIAAFLVLGFFPKPVLDVLNPAVDRTLTYVGVTDPSADQRLREHRSDRRRDWRRRVPVPSTSTTPPSRRCSSSCSASLVGVLVEAFAPRAARARHPGRGSPPLVLLGAFAALAAVVAATTRTVTLGGSVVVDGVSVFLHGRPAAARRDQRAHHGRAVRRRRRRRVHPDGRLDARARRQEDVATRAGCATSEVFPLTLFAVARDDALPRPPTT